MSDEEWATPRFPTLASVEKESEHLHRAATDAWLAMGSEERYRLMDQTVSTDPVVANRQAFNRTPAWQAYVEFSREHAPRVGRWARVASGDDHGRTIAQGAVVKWGDWVIIIRDEPDGSMELFPAAVNNTIAIPEWEQRAKKLIHRWALAEVSKAMTHKTIHMIKHPELGLDLPSIMDAAIASATSVARLDLIADAYDLTAEQRAAASVRRDWLLERDPRESR